MTTTNKPKALFWIISIFAILWNLMGVYQYLKSTLWKEEMYAEILSSDMYGDMAKNVVELMESVPAWLTGLYAIAVFSGLLGSILLALRKKWAVPTFLISLIAVVIQMSYWLFGTESIDIMGPAVFVMPFLVIVICIFLYFYSKRAAKKGILS